MNNPLDEVIEQAAQMAEHRQGETLLLLGEAHDPIPRALIQDPDLPAIAKLVWCHLRSSTGDPARPDMAPRYTDLMRDLSIGSRQTVAHCYHVLRLTRWITLITRHKDRRGYTAGVVYGLHTTPATIQQAFELDSSYPDLLQHLCGLAEPRHATLRSLARRVLDNAMDLVGQTEESALGRLSRLAGARTVQGNQGLDVYFRAAPAPQEPRHRESLPEIPEADDPAPAPDADLDHHDDILELSERAKGLVGMRMERVPQDMRQLFLNELAGIVRERQGGGDPIRNPVAYLNRMVQQFDEGTLVLSNRCEQMESTQERARRRQQQEADDTRREKLAEISHLEGMLRRRPSPELQAQVDRMRSDLRQLH